MFCCTYKNCSSNHNSFTWFNTHWILWPVLVYLIEWIEMEFRQWNVSFHECIQSFSMHSEKNLEFFVLFDIDGDKIETKGFLLTQLFNLYHRPAAKSNAFLIRSYHVVSNFGYRQKIQLTSQSIIRYPDFSCVFVMFFLILERHFSCYTMDEVKFLHFRQITNDIQTKSCVHACGFYEIWLTNWPSIVCQIDFCHNQLPTFTLYWEINLHNVIDCCGCFCVFAISMLSEIIWA